MKKGSELIFQGISFGMRFGFRQNLSGIITVNIYWGHSNRATSYYIAKDEMFQLNIKEIQSQDADYQLGWIIQRALDMVTQKKESSHE
jgi:hypothetical protein